MANEPAPTDRLNLTIKSLKNGLTSIPLSAAMDMLEAWQQDFLQSGQPALQDIGREIGNLQSLLTTSKLDGGAIGQSLSLLGSQTNQAAFQAPADQQADLRTIGDLLIKKGAELDKQR
ncbi:hypothetical protein [Hymenobacter jejuensis]|uniref:Uncharacterized protein n=1 Tax=Hymenobacter jejuensis TaxID=2502781 RepID=A0A5B7ZXH1_9BACT|nr:hypothetical protein [Hymenobacter jejuensis]QDA59499.1 hypothetical protein FHG12_04975 [Hymenobacter jejuensis]